MWRELASARARRDARLGPRAGRGPGAPRTVRMVRLATCRRRSTRSRRRSRSTQERTRRAALEKLAALGDHGLAAARVLEPVYRAKGPPALCSRCSSSRRTRARGRGAARGAPRGGRARWRRGRGRGGARARSSGAGSATPWPESPLGSGWRARRGGRHGTDPKRRAAILAKAIGDRACGRRAERAGEADRRGARGGRRRGDCDLRPRAGVRAALERADGADRRPLSRSGQPAGAGRAIPRRARAGGTARREELLLASARSMDDLGDLSRRRVVPRGARGRPRRRDAYAALAELFSARALGRTAACSRRG